MFNWNDYLLWSHIMNISRHKNGFLWSFIKGCQDLWHLWDTPHVKHTKKYMLELKLLIKLELSFFFIDISVYPDDILSKYTQAFWNESKNAADMFCFTMTRIVTLVYGGVWEWKTGFVFRQINLYFHNHKKMKSLFILVNVFLPTSRHQIDFWSGEINMNVDVCNCKTETAFCCVMKYPFYVYLLKEWEL